MERMLGVGAILAGTVRESSAMDSVPGTAEAGSMLLIGVALVLTAAIARHKFRSH